MKKSLIAALILAMVFAFTACGGGGNESSDSQDNGQESGASSAEMMGESVDLISCADGEIKFIGFQKADEKLTEEENAYVFVFEYTNHKDDPSQFQNTFWIQYFQNGSELSDSVTYNSAAKEQYDLVSASFNEALKDGTVRFGQIVVPKDDSPVTVMAKEQFNQDHYETIEVNLSDGTVTGGSEGDSDNDGDNSADVESLIQGDWVLGGTNTFRFENGAMSLTAEGGTEFSGEYTVNNDTSEIDCVLHGSDKDTTFHLPFKVQDGTLHLYNNQGEEMIHQ